MLKISSIKNESETTLSLSFDKDCCDELALEISLFAEFLRERYLGGELIEIVACFASLFVEFDVLKINSEELVREIQSNLSEFRLLESSEEERELLELPVYYHPEVAPDLEWLASEKNMTVDEVVRIHNEGIYVVSSLGFAPGFAYLSGLDSRLAVPRFDAPERVARGSLGIAEEQTAVYPNESPGGWVILGNCPVTLFDVDASPITPFKVGMKVRFVAISRGKFLAEGGEL